MKKVLIVDDYEDIHEILTFVLQDEEIEVKCLTSSDSLFNYLNNWKADLIMLDVRLGDADGRAVCDKIKANPLHSNMKVVLMSAMPNGWKNVPCKADAKVDKPFDIDEIKDLIIKLLNIKGNLKTA